MTVRAAVTDWGPGQDATVEAADAAARARERGGPVVGAPLGM